jgi:DNA-binding NarL/FixJ family response regulator
MNTVKIAVADDHPVSRKGIIGFIGESGQFEVIIEAANGRQLCDMISSAQDLPDICILDVKMPIMDGYEAAAWLKENFPEIKVLAMSMFRNEQVVIKMLRNGARGFILKESDISELRLALKSVYEDGYYYSELVSGLLVNKIRNQKKLEKELDEDETLFLKLACTDLDYDAISKEMNKSTATIDRLRQGLYKKLNVTRRAGLAFYAASIGII